MYRDDFYEPDSPYAGFYDGQCRGCWRSDEDCLCDEEDYGEETDTVEPLDIQGTPEADGQPAQSDQGSASAGQTPVGASEGGE